MKKLTGEEKRHLSEMHQRYGEGPIESTKLYDRMSDKWVKNFTYLTGHKKFTDKDLIFIHRAQPGLIGGILPHLDGK